MMQLGTQGLLLWVQALESFTSIFSRDTGVPDSISVKA
jgi:hypothetical protein